MVMMVMVTIILAGIPAHAIIVFVAAAAKK